MECNEKSPAVKAEDFEWSGICPDVVETAGLEPYRALKSSKNMIKEALKSLYL